MDIVLRGVSLTVLERQSIGSDIVFINAENVTNGLWPFTGLCDIKVEVARGTAKKWIDDSFGAEVLNATTFKKI
jgi:hypothetical protein